MRGRKAGLLPIEEGILAVGLAAKAGGSPAFHGFLAAARLHEAGFHDRLASSGSLYKALDRLVRAGMLTSQWEDAEEALSAGRPRRRLYEITPLGEQALAAASQVQPAMRPRLADDHV